MAAAASAVVLLSRAPAARAAAARVVSLELQLTEILISLGAPPVAAADNALYRRLVAEPALPATVSDLGPLQQPNLEFLQYLAPDLIILPAWQGGPLRATLARVATVAVIGDLSPKPPLERLEADVRKLAEAVDRRAQAEALLAAADETFDRARGSMSSQPTFLCRFFEDGRHLAMIGSKSVVGSVAERVGVTNARHERQSAFGLGVAAIEDLAAVPDARILHFHRGAETERALRRLERSPLWRALPAVRKGEVFATPVVHPNGG
ncbi:MAG: ABC transporter substrate-binding protein, partial [Hansschlegelia sp.]